MIWSIDGIEWTIPCAITRTAEVKATDISGFMMDGAYFNDVMGTYMSYDVSIAVPNTMLTQYYEVYELLAKPVGYHTFVLPYNDDEIEVTGRVESISDEWVYRQDGKNWWKAVRVTIIANTPTHQVDEDEIVNYGLSPFPQVSEVEEGTYYEFTSGGWVEVSFQNGDEIYY